MTRNLAILPTTSTGEEEFPKRSKIASTLFGSITPKDSAAHATINSEGAVQQRLAFIRLNLIMLSICACLATITQNICKESRENANSFSSKRSKRKNSDFWYNCRLISKSQFWQNRLVKIDFVLYVFGFFQLKNIDLNLRYFRPGALIGLIIYIIPFFCVFTSIVNIQYFIWLNPTSAFFYHLIQFYCVLWFIL